MKLVFTLLLLLVAIDIATAKVHRRRADATKKPAAPAKKTTNDHEGTYLTDSMGLEKDSQTNTGGKLCPRLDSTVCTTKSLEKSYKDWANTYVRDLSWRVWSTTRIPVAAAVLLDNMIPDAKTCKPKPAAKKRRRFLQSKPNAPLIFATIPSCTKEEQGKGLPCEWNLKTTCRKDFETAFLRIETLASMHKSIKEQGQNCVRFTSRMK